MIWIRVDLYIYKKSDEKLLQHNSLIDIASWWANIITHVHKLERTYDIFSKMQV